MSDVTSQNTGNYLPDNTNQITTGYGQAPALGALNPSSVRLSAAGLQPGGASSPTRGLTVNWDPVTQAGVDAYNDWRVRISIAPGTPIFYNDPNNTIMSPLVGTSGVVFPYTPQITVQHNARYGSSPLTHSNYNAYFYEGSEVAAITITGEFTVQTVKEGQYLMAVLQFFRSATKMFFGNGAYAGNPPPMVFLDGYGSNYFPHVSCVITNLTHTMPQDVDYVEIPVQSQIVKLASPNSGLPTRLPTQSQISVTLQPVYSRNAVHNRFNMQDFANGNLLGLPGIGGMRNEGGFI